MMKYLCAALFAVCLFTSLPSHATAVTKDMANKYYDNCMAQSDPRLSKDSQKSMCACTSAKMVESMSVEEIASMKGDKTIQNKVLLEVYAPCMSDPVRDMVKAECRTNPQVQGAKATEICDCMAKLTGDWYALSGRSLMAKALEANPDAVDPTAAIQDSAEFKSEAMKNLQSCMQTP